MCLMSDHMSCAEYLGDVRRDPVTQAIRDGRDPEAIRKVIAGARGQPGVTPEKPLRAAIVARDADVLDVVFEWAASLQWGGKG